jgi:hypothetical protein
VFQKKNSSSQRSTSELKQPFFIFLFLNKTSLSPIPFQERLYRTDMRVLSGEAFWVAGNGLTVS